MRTTDGQVLEAVGLEIVKAIREVRDEVAELRKAYTALAEGGAKINEFNLKQIEALTNGGIVGVSAMPGPPPPPSNGPRRL